MTKKRIFTLILTICMIVSTAFVFASCDLFFFLFPEDYEIPEGSAEFHFVDVGQGDATLIFADGKTILIDTGEKDSQNVLINYLKDKGIELIFDENTPSAIVSKMDGNVRGARDLRNVIRRNIEDKISTLMIDNLGTTINKILITTDNNNINVTFE